MHSFLDAKTMAAAVTGAASMSFAGPFDTAVEGSLVRNGWTAAGAWIGMRAADWVPRSVRKKRRELESAYRHVEQELGRSASDEEVARSLNVDITEFRQLLQDVQGVSLGSLEEVTGSDDNGEWTAEKVDEQIASGKTVTANFVKPLPVYIVYFSAAALNDGTIVRYSDLYNRDDEVIAALLDGPKKATTLQTAAR